MGADDQYEAMKAEIAELRTMLEAQRTELAKVKEDLKTLPARMADAQRRGLR